ncbi:MAG: hypothetical protein IJW65_03735 [Clostridia bacterium]|nr:hypothetical protein [Clostridia bacterium]
MLPVEFTERMKKMLGDEAQKLFDELENGETARSFRVNTNKISVEDFEKVNKLDAERMPHIPDGYYTSEEKPGNTAAHHSGMIYMQDPGAMSSVCAVEISRGMKVLDCCAAPGGKSSQLAAYVGEEGIVVSNEYVSKRASTLQGNLERMGCRSSVVLNLDARELCRTYHEYFDLVVCDAPCSGEGMFRKNDLAISEWSLENVRMCAERQKSIIDSIEKCVAVGGHLLYSTCTYSPEENEMLVDRFLSEHENFELVPVKDSIRSITADGINFDGAKHDMAYTRRFYPHISRGEGQFIALMKKTSPSEAASCEKASRKQQRQGQSRQMETAQEREALAVAREFLKKHLTKIPDKALAYRGGVVRLCPECPLPEYSVLMHGACVGEVVKGRLVPHHQLFSAYGSSFKNKVELTGDDPRVAEYIKGMEIDISDHPDIPDGYAALMVDGCALGGVKISGGRAKNHYPKGLRGNI